MKTEADRELHRYLTSMLTLRRTMQRPPECRYDCVEDFLLQHGTFFTPAPLPADVEPMIVRECFNNAYRVARYRRKLHYVEGIAIGVIPTLHAWLINEVGEVIDPTWANREGGGIGSSYIGVELTMEQVRLSRRAWSASVLEDYYRKFPALRGERVLRDDAYFTGEGGDVTKSNQSWRGHVVGMHGTNFLVECPDAPADRRYMDMTPRQAPRVNVGDDVEVFYLSTATFGEWRAKKV